jgi:predicted DNA-binding transcriptional regulator AlpA
MSRLSKEGRDMKEERFLPAREVCARYQICTKTLDRWVDDPELNFPKPKYIRRRRYFGEAGLDIFDRAKARRQDRVSK